MQNSLEKMDDQYFHRVWGIVKETYESERHFNNLETQYRILASQWLLGAFAGIGFVFISKPDLNFDKLWLVVGICVISCVGIFQLWRMDLTIYQRLLGAIFNAGIDLEEKFRFVPDIKHRMKMSVPNRNVTDVLFYYYYISIVLFAFVGMSVTAYLLFARINGVILAIPGLIVVVFLIWLHGFMRSQSRESQKGEQRLTTVNHKHDF